MTDDKFSADWIYESIAMDTRHVSSIFSYLKCFSQKSPKQKKKKQKNCKNDPRTKNLSGSLSFDWYKMAYFKYFFPL